MKDYLKVEKIIGVEFKNKALLLRALTHRSYLNENRKIKMEHNERLEFLGDAILELVVTDFLYKKYPHKTEGDLTSYRSAMVNFHILGEICKEMGINEFLFLSKGENKDTGRARIIILANTIEALIGAVYEDQGFEAVSKFIQNKIIKMIDVDEIVKKKLWLDAKSRFQEEAQEKMGITPIYKLLKENGPDHKKNFVVGVFLGDLMISSGEGLSKQEAEQDAAQKAILSHKW